ncbi:MAG: hypothetical protein JWO06_422 [Bacteroidota bacterium]|nr:hypothetical protein [Bacteroidota bacterium]
MVLLKCPIMVKFFSFKILLLCMVVNLLVKPLNAQQYIVPTVFHILHTGGTENISDAQVLDAMRILNDDFNKRNSDTINVVDSFKNNIANVGIEFRLANLDPQGQCTNGIEHIYTTQSSYLGNEYSKINDWPRNQYYNIWVYRRSALGIAGYATGPQYSDTVPEFDGLAELNNYIGSIGTSGNLTSRATTYLTGKYLNLYSTSGADFASCGDDSVADTPPTSYNAGCNLSASSCNPPNLENVQNFMNYSYCGCMFTNGQKARMRATLNNTLAQRNNLVLQANLIATGTSSSVQTPCAPICDFMASPRYCCVGASVKFTDNSYNGDITGRLWTFTNASIGTSTDPVVTVTFNTAGWQSVTLTVTNNSGSSTSTKSLVYVSDPADQITAPYYTGFDDATAFSKWAAINIDNDAPAFNQVFSAGHTNNTSIRLDNFNSALDGNIDELVSPPFDCSNLNSTTGHLIFQYSGASRSTDLSNNDVFPDSMEIFSSINCGLTWNPFYELSGANMINAGTVQNYFTPQSDNSYWRKVDILLSQNLFRQNVRFMISIFGDRKSNNFYLDDFIIGPQSTGINDNDLQSTFRIFPNPVHDVISIDNMQANSKYTMSVSDIQGRRLIESMVESNGSGNAQADLSALAAGCYLVRISNGQGSTCLRVVKN